MKSKVNVFINSFSLQKIFQYSTSKIEIYDNKDDKLKIQKYISWTFD